MRFAWGFLVALVVVASSSRAMANGRFPEALRLLEDPRNSNHLVLAGTFGLLETQDRGKNWYYICEDAFALQFVEGDPLLEVMADGTLLAGIDTLNLSGDCGCSWKTVLGASTVGVGDITVDHSAPQSVIGLLQDTSTTPKKISLSQSTDGGKTWNKLPDLPSDLTDTYTVDIAPSDPQRIYVTAISRSDAGVSRNVLLVSKNRGGSWDEVEFPGTPIDVQPFIAGVHPTNADEVFVRTDEWIDGQDPSANDALFVTKDAGKTWQELIRKGGKLFGFALSPDGNTVLAGYGDPEQASGRSTAEEDLGIYKAATSDFSFQKIFNGPTSCLRWTATGLYACNIQFFPDPAIGDFEVGFAANADFTATTANPFTTLLSLKNVQGPLSCVAQTCGQTWTQGKNGTPPVCSRFSANCDAGGGGFSSCSVGLADGGAGDSGPVSVDSGADSTTPVDAGGADSGVHEAGFGDEGGDPGAETTSCSCKAAGLATSEGASALGLFGALGAVVGLRRTSRKVRS
jgi:hypothetical protein